MCVCVCVCVCVKTVVHQIKHVYFTCQQTMPVKDFSTTLLCLMRVCWAAAAGQLHLASGNFDGEDEKEGQEEEEEEKDKEAESTCLLKLGICSKNKTATGKVRPFKTFHSLIFSILHNTFYMYFFFSCPCTCILSTFSFLHVHVGCWYSSGVIGTSGHLYQAQEFTA